ncbi:MAG: CDP-archaeol synthase [Solobacterium sp.]|nr:CDP-archaeol synthase [Solobacterium sp.]
MNKKMATKTVAALILVAVFVPIFLIGGWLLEAMIVVVACATGYEIAGIKDESKANWPMTILTAAAILILGHIAPEMTALGAGVWLVILFVISLLDESITADQVVYNFAMSFIMVLACRTILAIYRAGMNWQGAIYVALACFICDTGAYFAGSFLGKHKMIPRISPNKTWEGAIGGYLAGAVISMLFGLLVAGSIPNRLVVLASVLLPAAAEAGDLAFSSIKRRWKMKDFGSFIPEHGGMLDRIDSLMFCLIVFGFLMTCWGIPV